MNYRLTLALLGVVGLGTLAGCRNARVAAPAAPVSGAPTRRTAASVEHRRKEATTVPVTTSRVVASAIPIVVTAAGTVAGGANDRAALAFAEPGRIARVDVVVGERVVAGETLARLDAQTLAAGALEARAALDAATAEYAKVAGGARPQTIAETDARLQGARTQLAIARSALARAKQLFALGVGAPIDVETARSSVATARAQLDVDEQERSAQVRPFAPDVVAARASVDEARAGLGAARARVGYATLVAPFAGTVVARFHNDGESVDPSTPVVEIAKESGTVFTANFAPADALRVHRGDSATIAMSGTQATAAATVIAIDPLESSAAQTVPVLLRMSGGGLELGPGAYGSATIVVGSRRGLVVSSAAIVSDPTTGSAQVFRKEGDAYVPVAVTVGRRVGARTEIASAALRSGDVVVARGSYELLAPTQSAPADGD